MQSRKLARFWPWYLPQLPAEQQCLLNNLNQVIKWQVKKSWTHIIKNRGYKTAMLTCIAEVKQYLALTTCTAIVNPKDAQMGYQKKKVKEYNGS